MNMYLQRVLKLNDEKKTLHTRVLWVDMNVHTCATANLCLRAVPEVQMTGTSPPLLSLCGLSVVLMIAV